MSSQPAIMLLIEEVGRPDQGIVHGVNLLTGRQMTLNKAVVPGRLHGLLKPGLVLIRQQGIYTLHGPVIDTAERVLSSGKYLRAMDPLRIDPKPTIHFMAVVYTVRNGIGYFYVVTDPDQVVNQNGQRVSMHEFEKRILVVGGCRGRSEWQRLEWLPLRKPFVLNR